MTDWSWWQTKLEGQPTQMSEGTPHAGFYRLQNKDTFGAKSTFIPVAYWPAENVELNCRVGDRDVTPEYGRDLWINVGAHPVTEEAYRGVAERGEPWPDEHPSVPMGHNRPPEPNSYDDLTAEIEELERQAEDSLAGKPIDVANQDEADRIANLTDRLSELHKRAEDARKAEKSPHDKAAAAVQAKWLPLLQTATIYKSLKSRLLKPWLK